MKTTKLTRIFVLILSLALLIGSAVCVAASADEGDYAIKSINIAHGDQIKVLIAVDAPAEEAENITVSYVLGGKTYEATYWQNMDIYEDGTLYPVFYTIGIPAKDIGEAITAKVGNGAEKSLSVADYLYTKLYKEGYVFATASEDVARKNLYKNLLDYGSQAQEVLWNNKYPDAQRPLANVVVPMFLADGVSVAGQTGFVKLSSAGYADLEYTGSDLLVGWNVLTENGNQFFYNDVYVSAGAQISPVTVAGTDVVYDFEGEYEIDDSKVLRELYFADGVSVNSNGSTANSGELAEVRYEEGRGNYLYVYSQYRVTSTDRAHTVKLPAAVAVAENPNVTVLEFDYKNNGTNYYDDEFYFAGGYLYLGRTLNNTIAISQNEWVNVRLEAYYEQDLIQVYLDGSYAGDITAYANKNPLAFDEFDAASFNFYNGGGTVECSLDNISFYKTTKDYVAFPYTAKQFTTYDFENLDAYVIGTNPDFPNTGADIAGTPYYVANNGSTHSCTAGAEIVEDENGNNYFYMYSGKRVASTDRGWTFGAHGAQVEQLVPAQYANLGVLEFDIKIDQTKFFDGSSQASGSGMINWTFYFGGTGMSSNALRIDPMVGGTNINFAGNKFMSFNEWWTVRMEFNANDNSITVYSKLRGADEWEISFKVESTYDVGAVASYGKMENISGGAFYGAAFVGGNSSQMYSFSLDNMITYSTYSAE